MHSGMDRQFVSLSVCVYVSVCLCLYLCVSLSLCLTACLPACLPACLLACPRLSRLTSLSLSLFLFLSFSFSLLMSVPVCQRLSLSVSWEVGRLVGSQVSWERLKAAQCLTATSTLKFWHGLEQQSFHHMQTTSNKK